MLVAGVEEEVFPGAAFAISHKQELLISASLGRFTDMTTSPEVRPETVFDLASITKVVATSAMAMQLYEVGKLKPEQKVAEVLPEFVSGTQSSDLRRRDISLRMLLAHSSGLPAHKKFYEFTRTRQELMDAVFSTPLEFAPDTRTVYSDLGFILLGEALSRISGETLDRFCQRHIFAPLEMKQTTYLPPAAWKEQIPPTVNDQKFRLRIIKGEVQDENASVMGGISGHAGLFSNVKDVAKFARCMLGYGPKLFHPETIRFFTTRQRSLQGTSYALGWDTPSPPSQAGQYFSRHSFGHLGYTGTSLWIDSARAISITLLTNRTWPKADNQAIKQLRPRFHDAAMQELLTMTD